ncbi:MAG: hypothetical protein Q7R96_00155 [Nanoarchaeota archaeon]|nr:hypothetical protein [Nanoarchaeota archaeon]
MKKELETLELYTQKGFDWYRSKARRHMSDPQVERPHSLAASVDSDKGVVFSFSDKLLEEVVRNPRRLDKPHDVALRFGQHRFSRGGRNGIFYQRQGDHRLGSATDRLMDRYAAEIKEELGVNPDDFDKLRKVKIVYHQPSGERVVGVYNPENSRMIFLGFAHY